MTPSGVRRSHLPIRGFKQTFGRFIAFIYFLCCGVVLANVLFTHRSRLGFVSLKTNFVDRPIQSICSRFTGQEYKFSTCPICKTVKSGSLLNCQNCDLKNSSYTEGPNNATYNTPLILLSRIAGNDLPPLQSPGQLYYNIKYILEHESNFKDCEKRWIINKMANATMRGLLLDLFLEYGYRRDQIVINRINKTALVGLNETNWHSYELGVIALNEGRNLALYDGFKSGAMWVMPLDASQFITDESWRAILKMVKLAERKRQKYIKIPMFRLHQEQKPWILNATSTHKQILQYAPLKGESQLLFRRDAKFWFSKNIIFGFKDKLQLLYKACGNATGNPNKECGCSTVYPDILEGMPGWEELVPKYPTIMKSCGYGVRLWQYPCDEENLQQTVTSVEWRPLIRIEGRQRLMWYVLGKLKTFEDMCGRQHFTLMKKQVYRKHGKKRYLLCKPWGTATCPPRTNLNGSEPVL